MATRQEILNSYLANFDTLELYMGTATDRGDVHWAAGEDHEAIYDILTALHASHDLHWAHRIVIEALILMTDEEHLLAWLREANKDAPW